MTNLLRMVALGFVITFLLPTSTNAQLGLGGGLVYGSEADAIGVSAKGKLILSEVLAAVPNFTYFFVDNGDVNTINGDLHYFINNSNNFDLYALVGLNVAMGTINTEIGLNLGGGLEIMVKDNVAAYGEVKYVLSDFDQLVIAFGVLYYLGE
ncbi:MAG: hypothetical protein AAGG75_20120 [Bacteroidota bacterium]